MREIIKDNIEYDHFVRYGQVEQRPSGRKLFRLSLKRYAAKRKAIRIARDDYPAELVKAKFMKLNSSHIEFVFDCMKEYHKIRNIKQYLKAVLFNAPNTIDSYYAALVNHDMYGGTIQQSAKERATRLYIQGGRKPVNITTTRRGFLWHRKQGFDF